MISSQVGGTGVLEAESVAVDNDVADLVVVVVEGGEIEPVIGGRVGNVLPQVPTSN